MFKFTGKFLFKIGVFVFTLIFMSVNTLSYAAIPLLSSKPAWGAQIFIANQIKGIGLVDSYQEDGKEISYVYDNALAAMACIALGNYGLAIEILHTLCNEVKKTADSVLVESYYFLDTEGNGDGSAYCGNSAWLLQALNVYQKTYQDLLDLTAADYQAKNVAFYNMQKKLADYLLTLQDYNGDGGLKMSPSENQKSVENNIIAYVALKNFGRLNGAPTYVARADKIILFITSSAMWNTDHFNAGKTPTGEIETTRVLDVQALGTLLAASLDAFHGTNNYSVYSSALAWAENPAKGNLKVENQPFAGKLVTGFTFDEQSKTTNTIWLEGTLQAALAFSKSTDPVQVGRGAYYYNEAKKTIQSDGSVVLATNEGVTKWGWPLKVWRAIGPTAWLIFYATKFNPLVLYK